MARDLREDANHIIETCIKETDPGDAVRRSIEGRDLSGRLFLLAIGKAAWQMADAASDVLGSRIEKGIVITKYGHSRGDIGSSEGTGSLEIYEAGHPIPDENGYIATQAALDMVSGMDADDTLLLLISGGGSALLEKPLISACETEEINRQLIASGADINEINTVRKRLSAVKGGRLAEICRGRILQIILSDVIGDRLDSIASGPAAAAPALRRGCESSRRARL